MDCLWSNFSFIRALLLILIIVFSACKRESHIKNMYSSNTFLVNKNDKKTLKKTGIYSIPLDPSIGFDAHTQLVWNEKLKKHFLALGYKNSRQINIYDLENATLYKEMTFEAEGPNGVGTEMRGFVFTPGMDSVYLFSVWDRVIALAGPEGKVLRRYKLPPEDYNYPLSLLPETTCPITLNNNYLYITGLLRRYTREVKPIMQLNTISGETKLIGYTPEKVFSGNFSHLNGVKYDYLPETDCFILSFDISDSLFIFDNKNKTVTSKYADSKNIAEIKPISKNMNFEPSQEEKYAYLVGDSYWGIKYDPFRNLYYRFAVTGRTLDELYRGVYPLVVVMVLDEQFEVIHEVVLPEKSQVRVSFVGPKGLYIGNKAYYDDVSDDNLMFDIYSFEDK